MVQNSTTTHGMNVQENTELTKTSNTTKFSSNLTWTQAIKPRSPNWDSAYGCFNHIPKSNMFGDFFLLLFCSMPGNFNRNVIVHLKTEQTW